MFRNLKKKEFGAKVKLFNELKNKTLSEFETLKGLNKYFESEINSTR